MGLSAERFRALLWVHAISAPALKQMLGARHLAHARSESALAQAIIATDAEDARELLADVRDIASARLRLLRVCATLASTMGLLGGILLLAGAPIPDPGLVALASGGVARARMSGAITTMAIGVGSSAFCFQAVSIVRAAAQQLLAQAQQIERAIA